MSSFAIPKQIVSFLRCLEAAGYQAYLVGGCVRDGLMHLEPHDWDVCTDAIPDELMTLFPNSLTYGMRHGTVTVKWDDLFIEVTTFRSEGKYTDRRRPDHVSFIKDLREDLARRDFTVNAIAMDADGHLHDPFHGVQDLNAGVIRAVGSPEMRFQEDALRMLRAIRFSAQLGFMITPETQNAIRSCAPLTSSLSVERVAQEIEKTLLTERPSNIADMISFGLLRNWLSISALEKAEKLNLLAPERIRRWCGFCLLLQSHGEDVLRRFRLDRKTIDISKCCSVVRKQRSRTTLFWKQVIHRYGKETAEIAANVLSVLDAADDERILRSILERGDCCMISELAINGSDLKKIGFSGKEIGSALEAALRHVWLFPDQNVREVLLDLLERNDGHG